MIESDQYKSIINWMQKFHRNFFFFFDFSVIIDVDDVSVSSFNVWHHHPPTRLKKNWIVWKIGAFFLCSTILLSLYDIHDECFDCFLPNFIKKNKNFFGHLHWIITHTHHSWDKQKFWVIILVNINIDLT